MKAPQGFSDELVINEKAEELVKREDVKDSPFTIIGIEGKYFGVMGQYRLTEEGSLEEIREELKDITWNRLIQVVAILLEEESIRNMNVTTDEE